MPGHFLTSDTHEHISSVDIDAFLDRLIRSVQRTISINEG